MAEDSGAEARAGEDMPRKIGGEPGERQANRQNCLFCACVRIDRSVYCKPSRPLPLGVWDEINPIQSLFSAVAHNFLHTTFTEEVLSEQKSYYGRARQIPPAPGPDELGAQEEVFIGQRDSFYIASVNGDGWPYIQHRGGPRGFLRFIDSRTLGFADLSGNRQLLTTGNVAGNDRVALFLMDYPRRERLKILGHSEVIPASSAPATLLAELTPDDIPAGAVERLFRIHVTAYDWNCPKYITPRFTAVEVEQAAAPLKRRIAELEIELITLRAAQTHS